MSSACGWKVFLKYCVLICLDECLELSFCTLTLARSVYLTLPFEKLSRGFLWTARPQAIQYQVKARTLSHNGVFLITIHVPVVWDGMPSSGSVGSFWLRNKDRCLVYGLRCCLQPLGCIVECLSSIFCSATDFSSWYSASWKAAGDGSNNWVPGTYEGGLDWLASLNFCEHLQSWKVSFTHAVSLFSSKILKHFFF